MCQELQMLFCATLLHCSMDPGVMPLPATSISDLPPEIVRQILAAAVHGMRMQSLTIVASDARSNDKHWHDLLPYLQLRGVCSGYVLRTSNSCCNSAPNNDHAVDACQHRAGRFLNPVADLQFVLQVAQLARYIAAACGACQCEVSEGRMWSGSSKLADQPPAFLGQT